MTKRIGDTVNGTYYGVDITGVIVSADSSGANVQLSTPTVIKGVERTGVWFGYREPQWKALRVALRPSSVKVERAYADLYMRVVS